MDPLFYIASLGGTEAKMYNLITQLRDKFISHFVTIPGTNVGIKTMVPQGIQVVTNPAGPVFLQIRKQDTTIRVYMPSSDESVEFSSLPLVTKVLYYKLLTKALVLPVSTDAVMDTGL